MNKRCPICEETKDIEIFFGYRKNNPEYANSYCHECLRTKSRNYSRKYREDPENRKKTLLAMKKWQTENKAKATAATMRWRRNNRERSRATINANYHRRKLIDPVYKIKRLLRSRIYDLLAGKKSMPAMELIGCDGKSLIKHIEKQFLPGMTWELHGNTGFHIDHIRPLDSFDLTDPEQQKIAFHYTNLQPLWYLDNLKKSNKIIDNSCDT